MGKKTKDQPADMSSKEDKAKRKMMEEVAKHIRFSISTKEAVIKGQKVEYFAGQTAVDSLMSSKWTKEPKDKDDMITPHFSNRSAAIDYCSLLLRHQFFTRLNKVEVKSKPLPSSSTENSSTSITNKEGLRKRGEKVTDSPRAKKQGDGSDSEASKKKKRKFRLEVHTQQSFLDSPEALYFWQYDPPSRWTYLIGFAVVLGAIALTLQPLWPSSTRAGMWYLSMALFGVMGFMVLLIVARWFVFGLVQIFTVGKIKFWVFPNLDNEKCGFFESFRPLYSVEYSKKSTKKKSSSSSKKGAKRKGEAEDEAGEKDTSSVNEEDSEEKSEGQNGVSPTEEGEGDSEEKQTLETVTS